MRRRLCEAGLYGRISVKKPLLRKQSNVRRINWFKVLKDGTIEQWNKVLWIKEWKFEIFGSKTRVYVQQRVSERAAIPCITPTLKHGGGSIMALGAFANYRVGNLHQVKGKLNQTSYHSILQYHVIHLECSLWIKDLYACKEMTQSIQVNSARSTLKAKRNNISFN